MGYFRLAAVGLLLAGCTVGSINVTDPTFNANVNAQANLTLGTPAPQIIVFTATATPTPEACPLTAPDGSEVGVATQGRFSGVKLPRGWVQAYPTDIQIWQEISVLRVAPDFNWACFEKYYPDATEIYKQGAPSPTPKPSPTPTPLNVTAALCDRTSPDNPSDTIGEGGFGVFTGQHVPSGWSSIYHSEREVWEAVNHIYQGDDVYGWACFQKFYPGAALAWQQTANRYGSK